VSPTATHKDCELACLLFVESFLLSEIYQSVNIYIYIYNSIRK